MIKRYGRYIVVKMYGGRRKSASAEDTIDTIRNGGACPISCFLPTRRFLPTAIPIRPLLGSKTILCNMSYLDFLIGFIVGTWKVNRTGRKKTL